jgi:hypothetical protein
MDMQNPQLPAPVRPAMSFARMLVLAQRRFRARQPVPDARAPAASAHPPR